MGSQSVVVCVVNILEARADSRFYRVLLKLLVMGAATGSQWYSVFLAWLYLGFAFVRFKVQQSHVYTHHYWQLGVLCTPSLAVLRVWVCGFQDTAKPCLYSSSAQPEQTETVAV